MFHQYFYTERVHRICIASRLFITESLQWVAVDPNPKIGGFQNLGEGRLPPSYCKENRARLSGIAWEFVFEKIREALFFRT